MKLTDKQKKALWIAGAVLIVIHYAPTFINMVRQQSAGYRTAQAKPSPIPAPDRASQRLIRPSLPDAPSVSPEAMELSKLVGLWAGGMPVPGMAGGCEIRLELKAGTEKPGFTGYSTMSCANVQRFRPGQRNLQNLDKVLLDATPVSAILSGVIEGDNIVLRQDRAFGAESNGCNIVEFILTPFSELMGASWKEGTANWKQEPVSSCPNGQVIMHRVRAL